MAIHTAPIWAASCAGVRVDVATSLNVRSGPGTSHATIGSIYNNQRYHRLNTASNGWLQIQFDSGSGYVHPDYVEQNDYDNCRSVTASSLNIRSGPATNYGIVGRAPYDTRWFTHGSSGSWSRIYYSGASRYGYSAYLADEDTGSTNPTSGDVDVNDYTATVTASVLNVRSGPGTQHAVNAQLNRDTQVTVTHHNGSWRKIESGSVNGYVHSAYLVTGETSRPPPSISNFRINNGATTTSSQKVTLNFSRSGTRPTQYRASQNSDFAGATWQPYNFPIEFILTPSEGWKQVYFQTRDGNGRTSATVNDAIQLIGCFAQTPATFTYNEIILPARDNIVVRTQPVVDPCTDTGERVDMDTDEVMRVRGEQNGWFYIDAIVNRNGTVLRNSAGWVHNSDIGTNEAVRIYWDLGSEGARNMDMTIRIDDTTDRVFFNQQFSWNHGGAGYFGFQQFPEGRKFIFSLFSTTPDGPGSVVEYDSDFSCTDDAPDEPGIVGPLRCLDDFAWAVGQQYTLRLRRFGTEAEGTRWLASILDGNGSVVLDVGSFVIRTDQNTNHLISNVISFIEDFGNGRDCSVPLSTRFHVSPPTFNDNNETASYVSDSIGPCSNGSTVRSTRFSGGRELRFNIN